jgi:hypothetical protein
MTNEGFPQISEGRCLPPLLFVRGGGQNCNHAGAAMPPSNVRGRATSCALWGERT